MTVPSTVELLGGELSLVASPRALVSQPKVPLLDESFAGLSARYVSEVVDRLAELCRSATLLVAS